VWVRILPGAPILGALNMSDGGKGSSPRPFSVANEEYAKRWDAIFSRDLEEVKEVNISVAQLAEQRSPKPKVEGSIPSRGAN